MNFNDIVYIHVVETIIYYYINTGWHILYVSLITDLMSVLAICFLGHHAGTGDQHRCMWFTFIMGIPSSETISKPKNIVSNQRKGRPRCQKKTLRSSQDSSLGPLNSGQMLYQLSHWPWSSGMVYFFNTFQAKM